MALHTCQIQQYDFNHCEQQFEKLCGKGERTPFQTTVGIILFCRLFPWTLLFPGSVQPSPAHILIDEDMTGGYGISSRCVSS